jgi:hypothetical protein
MKIKAYELTGAALDRAVEKTGFNPPDVKGEGQ